MATQYDKPRRVDLTRQEIMTDQISLGDTIITETEIDGDLTFSSPVVLPVYTVATVPDATSYPGGVIIVSNGADGASTIAWSDGTDWLEVDGTAIDDGA